MERSSFFHPLIGQTLDTIRGGHPGAYEGGAYEALGTFRWSRGVKGVTQLLLKSIASGTDRFILTGRQGSLAGSLDYALNKEPQWLLDMFGTDSRGRAFAKRLFKVSNSGRRAGPVVSISLNSSLLPVDSISLIQDFPTPLYEKPRVGELSGSQEEIVKIFSLSSVDRSPTLELVKESQSKPEPVASKRNLA